MLVLMAPCPEVLDKRLRVTSRRGPSSDNGVVASGWHDPDMRHPSTYLWSFRTAVRRNTRHIDRKSLRDLQRADPRGQVEVVRQPSRSQRPGSPWNREWLARRVGQGDRRQGSTAREAIRQAVLLEPGKQPKWLLDAADRASAELEAL
jgi:hypothetical protein